MTDPASPRDDAMGPTQETDRSASEEDEPSPRGGPAVVPARPKPVAPFLLPRKGSSVIRGGRRGGDEHDDEEEEEVVCCVCGDEADEDKLLLCDGGCELGYHIFCLDPPLQRVPSSELWFCPDCAS